MKKINHKDFKATSYLFLNNESSVDFENENSLTKK